MLHSFIAAPGYRSLFVAQHGASHLLTGLFAGGGVHEEVLDEHLGIAGAGGAILGVVLGLKVDGRSNRSYGGIEGSRLAVGTSDTVALRVGGQNHELQVGDILRDGSQLDGESLGGECRSGRSYRPASPKPLFRKKS